MNVFQQALSLIGEVFTLFVNPVCLLFGHKFKLQFRSYVEVDGRIKRKNGLINTTYCCRCGVRDDRDNRSSIT
jgi:hypothetical protein